MSGPNLNKLPKINDKQISSERLLSLVKARSLDFRIDSPGRFGSSSLSDLGIEDLRLTIENLKAVLLYYFTSRILSVLWFENCDLHSHRIKIPQNLSIKKQKKFLQLGNFQKLNNQDFAKNQ